MDRSNLRRPAIQTARPKPKITSRDPQFVRRGRLKTPQDRPTTPTRPAFNEGLRRLTSNPTTSTQIVKTTTSQSVNSGLQAAPTAYNKPGQQLLQQSQNDNKTAVATPVRAANASVQPKRQPLDMELPVWAGEDHFELVKRRARSRQLRRRLAQSTAVSLVLLITLGGLLISQSYLKLHKVFKGGAGTAAALQAEVDPNMLRGEGRGRVNILLLGRGGGTHDAPDLTDTIMLASIDPVNHTSTLVSIPRDLWVNVQSKGVMKLNAVWQTGEFQYLGKNTPGSTDPKAIRAGFDMVDQTVEDILGVNIDYNVLVNFQGFKQAVDTVGDIDINVPADLVDPTMAWENHNNPVLAKAGIQAFNGTQALLYVRSRETSSDFARADRQRAVLITLKDRIDNMSTLSNPLKLDGLLNTFGNNVQTDLSLSNANRLYKILKQIDGDRVSSIGLTDTAAPGSNSYLMTGNISGQSIVLPKAGLFKYSDIQQFMRSQLKDPYIIRENAKIIVLNGTSVPGLADSKASELRSYGYNVIGTGSTPGNNWTRTIVVDLTHNKKYTKNYLEQHFGTRAANSLADPSISTNGADFAIIIGSDETTSSVN